MDTRMYIGKRLRQARIDANLTAQQVADAIGRTKQSVYNWEQGRRTPKQEDIISLAKIYQVDIKSFYPPISKPIQGEFGYTEEPVAHGMESLSIEEADLIRSIRRMDPSVIGVLMEYVDTLEKSKKFKKGSR